MLSNIEVEKFNENGFVIIDDFLSPEQLDAMKKRALQIVTESRHDNFDSKKVFTTKNNDRTENDFFLDSAESIACFFEENAYDVNGQLVQDYESSINKIGHALHELDPVFEPISHLPSLGVVAKQLGLLEPQIRQSMYIFKQPRIGGVVNWHQDATFFYSTPMSVVTFWFAVDDANLSNGCLWVEEGALNSPLRERFNCKNRVTTMEILDESPWPTENSGTPIEVKAGTLICFKGNLPHYSAANRSDKSRHAFTLHVTDGRSEYADTNWLQTKLLPLRGFNTSE